MKFGDTEQYNNLKVKADAIYQKYGSDRGFKAIEDYYDNIISIVDLTDRLCRIEKEEADETPRRNHRFDQYVSVAADDISMLRKQDVFRVMELACSKTGIAIYIKRHRPDLESEVDEVLLELLTES